MIPSFFRAILSGWKPSTNEEKVLRLDANDRLLINSSSSVQPIVGSTPPSAPSDGDIWYNNSLNQSLQYSYSAALGLWLTDEFPLSWGEDSMDSNNLGWAGINTAGVGGSGTRVLLPRDCILTVFTARIRAGDASKQMFLQVNGVTVSTQALSGGQVISFPNIQVNAGDTFWVIGDGAGASVQDIVINTWWRWRVNP
jgi:hypothetical protein